MELASRVVYGFAVLTLIYIAPWWIIFVFFVAGLLSIRWYFELFVFSTLYVVLQFPVRTPLIIGVLIFIAILIVALEYMRDRYLV